MSKLQKRHAKEVRREKQKKANGSHHPRAM